ncbi:hypothetical protein HG15A2_04190 [Adhaeretor mobilis]|uniref:Uncharacterized protein n=1 Tax=Adhaeretor mobilis TaxID=1930276 RepID=A0A517MQJ7_9BACT|nr:hypothetical protein HG15A2_04190 [Adhaeretor mobilis]
MAVTVDDLPDDRVSVVLLGLELVVVIGRHLPITLPHFAGDAKCYQRRLQARQTRLVSIPNSSVPGSGTPVEVAVSTTSLPSPPA